MSIEGRRITIRGIVQGVGFRPWVYRLAHEAGVTGRVSNDGAGVAIEVFGDAAAIGRFERALSGPAPPSARLDAVETEGIPAEHLSGFTIVTSENGESRRVSIPPDLATCDRCLREVFDETDRRHRYPFTNCTDCGPRFTITRDVPYDRATTTMARFVMCAECAREYQSPTDRRFHAEPNACPVCGPSLVLLRADGRRLPSGDPLVDAARALSDGLIIAVKGLGGFHLACDATSSPAVARLRERKRREEKPFAVMVADLDAVQAHAVAGDGERRVLAGVERPIVLLPKRRESRLAPEIAPRNPYVGLMLPYTPLHHVLLRETGGPLVMTSGNLSEEPLAYRNDEAVKRLAGIADFFLVHDRDIETPCDDSVVRVIADRPVLVRRSRGYVPRAVRLARSVGRPTLGCGALLKNTFCLAEGRDAWMGPHVGDLDGLATFQFYEAAIARLERFLGIRPEVVAHDLHPDYASTAYALSRTGVGVVGVQHHHAHVASAMAEHGLEGPVLGLAYDGTGYGTDGSPWGGELLLADYRGFERLATFRPIALAGGDTAIRQVWRIALALLMDAFGDDVPRGVVPLLAAVSAREHDVVRQMIVRGVNTPRAHGVGRYFDGFGALGLGRAVSHFEGQVALEWNGAADPAERRAYPFEIDQSRQPWEVDLRGAVRGAVEDLRTGREAGVVSARFHNALALASVELVRLAARARAALPVVLTGGVFQNPRLAAAVHAALTPDFHVYLHAQVPPGDGGIALGQVVVARGAA
jgi:hydrogenase maturation protein HypF